MTRGVWAAVAVCALGGCNSPQYYTAPAEKLPPAVNIGGTTVQFVDQRPEWEKKPFTGPVCLYHLDKAHPGGWNQLAEEAGAVVAAMPQKPERVEIEVTSYRLVRAGDTGKRYKDVSTNAAAFNPSQRFRNTIRENDDARARQAEREGTGGATEKQIAADRPGNDIELMFASKDDPRMILREHPTGASCALRAKVKMVFPGGREQTVDVSTIARGANESGTVYWGEAIDFAAKTAVQQFGQQFRTAVGVGSDSQPLLSSGEVPHDVRVRPSSGP